MASQGVDLCLLGAETEVAKMVTVPVVCLAFLPALATLSLSQKGQLIIWVGASDLQQLQIASLK